MQLLLLCLKLVYFRSALFDVLYPQLQVGGGLRGLFLRWWAFVAVDVVLQGGVSFGKLLIFDDGGLQLLNLFLFLVNYLY